MYTEIVEWLEKSKDDYNLELIKQKKAEIDSLTVFYTGKMNASNSKPGSGMHVIDYLLIVLHSPNIIVSFLYFTTCFKPCHAHSTNPHQNNISNLLFLSVCFRCISIACEQPPRKSKRIVHDDADSFCRKWSDMGDLMHVSDAMGLVVVVVVVHT
jgi:hypothetical protein